MEREMDGEPIAVELAKKQRVISVAEFFSRNRHLLGFDNKKRALLTTVKEAVDNSLDACEEAGILPEIEINIVDLQNDRFRVIVTDNGPGIVDSQIPRIFGKLLYGSKFFKLSQTRGQQGIGISASVLYGQMTTGRPAGITSRIAKDRPASYHEIFIDTNKNEPQTIKKEIVEWDKEHGTKVEIDLEAEYFRGMHSVDAYVLHVAIVNPHATVIYSSPGGQTVYSRVTDQMPAKPVEIKPHPYGVELGVLLRMVRHTKARTLQQFLCTEFTRVGSKTAKEICANAALLPKTKPNSMSRELAEKLMEGIKKTRLIAPPTNCLSPIGEKLIEIGLKKEINAEFYCSVSRPPSVYRGNPFLIEAGLAYGGSQKPDETVDLLRFANRVPLMYQQGACAITKGMMSTSWRKYGLQHPKGALPVGPVSVLIHVASVWVPFTSESKGAVAHYPEIIKEIRLALQELGRKLQSYLHHKTRVTDEIRKRSYIEKYLPHIGLALKEIIELNEEDVDRVTKLLAEILEKRRGKVEKGGDRNPHYDDETALSQFEEKGETKDESQTAD